MPLPSFVPSISLLAPRPHPLLCRRPRAAPPARAAPVMRHAAAATTADAAAAAVAAAAAAAAGRGAGRGQEGGEVLAIGLSHHTASVGVRERVAIAEAEWGAAAKELVERSPSLREAAVLSTCNRFEIYVLTAPGAVRFQALREVLEWLAARSDVAVPTLRRGLFMLGGAEAVWHLLRVSGGLDSLVVGEGQILAQVKRCFEVGTSKEGCCGKVLSRLLNVAVAAGKRVRNETGISKGAVSISSAAVELVDLRVQRDTGLDIKEARVLVIGAGNMSRLLVQHLVARGCENIEVVNRSSGRMEQLARMFPDVPLKLYGLERMLERVGKADVLFTSTGSRDPILFKDNFSGVAQQGKRYMVVDISVPRNVSEDVAEMEGVTSYNVDDLKAVVAKNQARRRRLVLDAEGLLKEEQRMFDNWHHSLGCVPAITKLQKRAESIRADEMDKVRGKLAKLSKAEIKTVEQLSRSIINKMLHSPMVHLRGLSNMEERNTTLKNLESLFKL